MPVQPYLIWYSAVAFRQEPHSARVVRFLRRRPTTDNSEFGKMWAVDISTVAPFPDHFFHLVRALSQLTNIFGTGSGRNIHIANGTLLSYVDVKDKSLIEFH